MRRTCDLCRHVAFRIGFVALMFAVGACFFAARPGTELPCSGRVCVLAIQNDAPVSLAVRYADTTGRQGVLGVVGPRAMKVFRIQWIYSSRLRIMVLTHDGGRYDAQVPLPATRATQVHFPDDFTLVDDDQVSLASGPLRSR
jgi:hypothetical protein